jgi:Co/Zn/Cd efflux system component
MLSHSMENFRHSHVFLGESHEQNERRTWAVILVCSVTMFAEIVGGLCGTRGANIRIRDT